MKLLSLNIGNPSLNRAKKQCAWLENRPEDVFVLTKTKNSRGCDYIENFFSQYGYDLFSVGAWNGTGKSAGMCERETGLSLFATEQDTAFGLPCKQDKTVLPAPEYHVIFPEPKSGELGVMLISKYPILRREHLFSEGDPFYPRQLEAVIAPDEMDGRELSIVGIYAPTRDRSSEKIRRKKDFLSRIERYLRSETVEKEAGEHGGTYAAGQAAASLRALPDGRYSREDRMKEREVRSLQQGTGQLRQGERQSCAPNRIILGDLNILDREHVPHYTTFFGWEYDCYEAIRAAGYLDAYKYCHPDKPAHSWISPTGKGYRYDHCFLSNTLQPYLRDCRYDHTPRELGLSDHAAVIVELGNG